MLNLGVATTLEDRIADLGNIPLSRVIHTPPIGTATWRDVVRIHDEQGRLCELVDGTLVEKTASFRESLLTTYLTHAVMTYLDAHPIGIATGPSAMFRLFGDTVRGGSVAFTTWTRLPGRKIPIAQIPEVVPNFVIEVLRVGNTYGEMSRKRREYFQAGAELVWMVDPRQRTVAVYRSALDVQVYREGEKLDGGAVLPGFEVDTGALFAKLDQTKNENDPSKPST